LLLRNRTMFGGVEGGCAEAPRRVCVVYPVWICVVLVCLPCVSCCALCVKQVLGLVCMLVGRVNPSRPVATPGLPTVVLCAGSAR
jgi:hypothetical protein